MYSDSGVEFLSVSFLPHMKAKFFLLSMCICACVNTRATFGVGWSWVGEGFLAAPVLADFSFLSLVPLSMTKCPTRPPGTNSCSFCPPPWGIFFLCWISGDGWFITCVPVAKAFALCEWKGRDGVGFCTSCHWGVFTVSSPCLLSQHLVETWTKNSCVRLNSPCLY